jgi:hypothetical protein
MDSMVFSSLLLPDSEVQLGYLVSVLPTDCLRSQLSELVFWESIPNILVNCSIRDGAAMDGAPSGKPCEPHIISATTKEQYRSYIFEGSGRTKQSL